ncbi:hypothetical protein A9G48_02785 [Gilliamella sp. wkB18]|uniref:hypothetical protein n=1 Tax=Gilliamella sp. wkB18 TaxID=3120260 RepID=UPI00054CF1BB|nr:hypothetical protein [Gilliamella apicola]OCG64388.1 hypothetical protein A9G48_02785 [Gilliamella apicola]
MKAIGWNDINTDSVQKTLMSICYEKDESRFNEKINNRLIKLTNFDSSERQVSISMLLYFKFFYRISGMMKNFYFFCLLFDNIYYYIDRTII